MQCLQAAQVLRRQINEEGSLDVGFYLDRRRGSSLIRAVRKLKVKLITVPWELEVPTLSLACLAAGG